MSVLAVVAGHELLASRRLRSPRVLMSMFVAMVAAASFIGWLTQRTVSGVYRQVLADGLTAQPDPFASVAPMYFARNTVIYVVMIGTLMAAVLGVQSALRDRRAGTADLVLTRPPGVRVVLAGRLSGLAVLLAGVVGASTLASWIAISLVVGAPVSVADSFRLVAWGGVTWVLLVGFAALGMWAGLHVRRETSALVAPVVAWAVIAFVIPQLGTAARPVSLLNPVATPPQTTGVFHMLSYLTGPASITEHFKTLSTAILEGPAWGLPVGSLAVVLVFAAVMVGAVLLTPAARLRGASDD
ncbi:ABC transporter permease [Demequina sp.]|uniref:ABC transporter permease n=1 Tax=Demequina sp. TaxID=2050685 RepID=UPI0025F22B9B|nr:ABC transporter permease [Demequina sp.]